MDFARQQRDPTRHLIGITAVVLVHALVVYALVTGLARKAIEVIKKPLTATIVEEIKAPPPPPPPPPKKIEVTKAPPPPEQPYVPPPDVPPPVTAPEPVIAAVTPTPPPVAPVIAPPQPVVVAPPKPAIVRNPNPINSCAPAMPGEAMRKNIEGSVLAHMYVDEKGDVTEVKIIQASDRMFERAAVNALKNCKFRASADKWVGEQEIDFKLQ
jgi:protein TonB